MKSKQEVFTIVAELRRELERVYGSRLKEVYLFGSYARGDADEDSDIDVAVVLQRMRSRFEERQRCSELRAKISLDHSCVINLFFFETTELSQAGYAIHRSVVKEGILI